jgi:bifunctional non-homologous end joining protein LigD
MAFPDDGGFVEPMLATLVREPFDDPAWVFEVKWDGFRVEALVRGGTVQLWTRGHKDATRYFGAFLEPPTWLSASSAVLDGEVVALDAEGRSDFALLQRHIRARSPTDSSLVYQVFDLLELDGVSLVGRPLEERRDQLRSALGDDPRVRLGPQSVGQGRALFAEAARRGWEGIVAKRRDSTYEPGRRAKTWLKIKIRPEQELIVVGLTPGRGYAAELGALLVAVYDGRRLRYCGRVGTGFDRSSRTDLVERLRPLVVSEPAIELAPHSASLSGTVWVEPRLVIRAEFASWTTDGLVRQASFKGVDFGKDPRTVRRERPAGSSG